MIDEPPLGPGPVLLAMYHLASLLGLHVASVHLLKRYIAISSHLPSLLYIPPENSFHSDPAPALPRNQDPLLIDEGAVISSSDALATKPSPVSTPPAATSSSTSGWRVVFISPIALKICAGTFAWPIWYFLMRLGVPNVKQQGPADLMWGVMAYGVMTYTFYMASYTLYQDRIALSTLRKRTALEYLQLTTHLGSHARLDNIRYFIALALSAAVMTFALFGSRVLVPLHCAASVMTGVSLAVPDAILPSIIGMLGFTTAVPALTLLVWLLTPTSASTPIVPVGPSHHAGADSQWAIEILLTFAVTMPVYFPGILTALTLRYEHSLTYPPKRHSAKPVLVPLTIPSFPHPIYNGSMVCLALSLIFTNYILPLRWPRMVSPMLGVFVVVPLTCGGTALTAWYSGKLKEWMTYEEAWIPTYDEVKVLHNS